MKNILIIVMVLVAIAYMFVLMKDRYENIQKTNEKIAQQDKLNMLTNIFENIKIDKKNEQFIDLLKHKNLRVERIVSNGQSSPVDFWYEQEENEFVLLLKGEAVLEFEDKELLLKEGDFVNIPSKEKHRVKYTSKTMPTIWLAIFYKN